MNLVFYGHDYRYGVEQMLLTLFPQARPVYPDGPGEGDSAVVSLHRGAVWYTAVTRLTVAGDTAVGRRRLQIASLPQGERERESALRRVVGQSFYRAAVEILGTQPPWGSLTGVRPVKLAVRAWERTGSRTGADSSLRDTYYVTAPRRELALDCAQAAMAVRDGLREDEISLYLGIPFCPTRCAYCSFISASGTALSLTEPYLAGLLRETQAAGRWCARRGLKIRSVYIGGGTPTTLTAGQLSRLLAAVGGSFDLSRCGEFTVEAGRPDTITREKLAAILEGGGNRISVNPQTLEPQVLAAMGRDHRPEDALAAYRLARQSGIPAVNMDLIAGLPTDSLAGFCRTVDSAVALRPENLTVHTLALKRGSRLREEGGTIPPPEEVGEMLAYAWSALRRAGYAPYYLYRQKFMSGSFENVGWTLPGWASLYNVAMMEELQTILSLGSGGVTKLVGGNGGAIIRVANPKYPQEYLRELDRIIVEKEGLTWPIS